MAERAEQIDSHDARRRWWLILQAGTSSSLAGLADAANGGDLRVRAMLSDTRAATPGCSPPVR